MFDAADFQFDDSAVRVAGHAMPGSAIFVCAVAMPGKGWRRRAGTIHVLVVETIDGPFTQVCRVPPTGRDVFVERIFAGSCADQACQWALERFGVWQKG